MTERDRRHPCLVELEWHVEGLLGGEVEEPELYTVQRWGMLREL